MENLERENFMFFISHASFYEMVEYRNANEKRFDFLCEKYKEDISKLPLKRSGHSRINLEDTEQPKRD